MIQIIWFAVSLILTAATIAFYLLIIKPTQHEKNILKQEAKERAEVDELFIETTTGNYRERSCKERCYENIV